MSNGIVADSGSGETSDVVMQLTQAVSDWMGTAADAPVPDGQRTATTVSAQLLTNITPPIPLAGGGEGSGLGARLLAWIQPTILGSLPLVGPVNIAPYGVASAAVGTVVFYSVLGLAVYGGYKLLRGR